MRGTVITGCGPACVFFEAPAGPHPPMSCGLRRAFKLFDGRSRVGEFPHFTPRQMRRVMGERPVPPKWCPLRRGIVLGLPSYWSRETA